MFGEQGNDESAGVCRDGMEMSVFGVMSEVGVVVAIRSVGRIVGRQV